MSFPWSASYRPQSAKLLARRLRELAGLGLIALAGVAAAALMTWSVQDPSLSHATSRAIRNVVGYPGAIGADLLMQILGLGAIMLILPVAVWGWRMLTHRTFDREALRLGCWILCTVISAGFASCWPHGGAWPLPTGLGGVVGDALVRAPAVVFGPPGFLLSPRAGNACCSSPLLATFLFASGMGSQLRDDDLTEIEEDDAPFEEDEDGGSVSLGWAFHAADEHKSAAVAAVDPGLQLAGRKRAGAARSFRSNARSQASAAPAPSLAPRANEELDEDEGDEEEEERGAAPRLAQEARLARAGAQIQRPFRAAAGFGAERAEGLRPSAALQVRA